MKDSKNNNLELWNKVEKTNPKYTKKAKIGGMGITAISPQYQIMMVTEQFGPYGKTWGFKNIELDYSLIEKYDMVVFKGTFFFPEGEFEIINSIKLYINNAKTMLDDNFAKKVETDALTKAISKLGFNADIFLGKFDDVRYLEETSKEFEEKELGHVKTKISDCKTIDSLRIEYKANQNNIQKSEWLKGIFNTKKSELELKQKQDFHIQLKEKIKEINKLGTLEELTNLYNNEPNFIENKEFMSALTNRKEALAKLFKE